MVHRRALIDTSSDLILQRHWNGVRLFKPQDVKYNANPFIMDYENHTVGSVLQLPLNVFFMNKESVVQTLNETTVSICGFQSIKDAIGRTVSAVADKETSILNLNDDRAVIQSNACVMRDEHFIRIDSSDINFISIKWPWYGECNEIIGVFGCAIAIETTNHITLSDRLSLIIKAGLLDGNSFHSHKLNDNTYLSKRELECLQLLMRGRTAKGIAKELKLSVRTVEHYINNMKIKLKVTYKSELVEKGFELFSKSKPQISSLPQVLGGAY